MIRPQRRASTRSRNTNTAKTVMNKGVAKLIAVALAKGNCTKPAM